MGIGLEEERFRYLLELDHLTDLRRALRYTPPSGFQRFRDEEIYPMGVGPDKDSWMSSYLMYAQASEPPTAWHFWVGLSVIGAAARRNLYIDKNVYYIWPNLYLILVGSTTMKKSTCMNIGSGLLYRINHYLEKKNVKDYRHIRIMPQRCTPERFINIMKSEELHETEDSIVRKIDTESVGVIFNSEMVLMLGKTTFHADHWIHLLTALYDSPDYFDGSTIGRGDEALRNVALTFVGGSTADWIRSSVTEDMFGGGFMGRCIFSRREDHRREYPEPEPLDPITASWLAEGLVEYSQMPLQEFIRSPSWIDYFGDWYHENRQVVAPDVKMKGYFGRKPTHMEKVAMLIALSRGRCTGKVEDLEMARVVLDREEKELPDCFGEMLAHQDSLLLDKIYNTIVRNNRCIQHSTLQRRVIRDVGNAFNLKRMLETLKAEGKIKAKYDKVKRTTYWVAPHEDQDLDEPDD